MTKLISSGDIILATPLGRDPSPSPPTKAPAKAIYSLHIATPTTEAHHTPPSTTPHHTPPSTAPHNTPSSTTPHHTPLFTAPHHTPFSMAPRHTHSSTAPHHILPSMAPHHTSEPRPMEWPPRASRTETSVPVPSGDMYGGLESIATPLEAHGAYRRPTEPLRVASTPEVPVVGVEATGRQTSLWSTADRHHVMIPLLTTHHMTPNDMGATTPTAPRGTDGPQGGTMLGQGVGAPARSKRSSGREHLATGGRGRGWLDDGGLAWRMVELVVLAMLVVTPVAGHYDRGGPQHRITWGRGNTASSAVFGDTPTNVTAVLGHRARLPCQVKNLGLKDVSWIRQRDIHILTVGIFTYTSDDRFKVFHPPETEDWFLDISSVTFRDAGVYECQVSTSPKVSLPVYLTVLGVQEADIPGPHEVFIQHGSTISLVCVVRAGVEAVGPVHWLRGSTPLNYSSPRGGISSEVEKTPTQTTSKLYITRAVRADSGNYTCAPKFTRPDSVLVHVVNAGEESAAAVHSGGQRGVQVVGSWVVWAAFILALALVHSMTLDAPSRHPLLR